MAIVAIGHWPNYGSFAKKIIDSLMSLGALSNIWYLFLIAKQTLSKAHDICAKRDYDPQELFAHSNHATYSGKESEISYVNFWPGLHNFLVEVDEHAISVRSSINCQLYRFVPAYMYVHQNLSKINNKLQNTWWIHMVVGIYFCLLCH